MKSVTIFKLIALLLLTFSFANCTRGWSDWNRSEKGAVIGGTSGAVVGGVIGHQLGSSGAGAVVGGAAGAGAGALIGHEQDKDRRRNRY